MSAALGQPLASRLTETPGYLRAEFGYGTATEIAELFRALAVTCIQKQVARVLILAGDEEPAGERALRNALSMIVLAGLPAGFRLALVAALARVQHTYRKAPSDFAAAGIESRLFESEEEAVRWLDPGGDAGRSDATLSALRPGVPGDRRPEE